jgi:hypothetical protein
MVRLPPPAAVELPSIKPFTFNFFLIFCPFLFRHDLSTANGIGLIRNGQEPDSFSESVQILNIWGRRRTPLRTMA